MTGASQTSAANNYFRRLVFKVQAGEVIAGVEDDYHHFRVVLRHDGLSVTAIEGVAVRTPWTTCPGAVAPLGKLVGQAIATNAPRRDGLLDRHQQCTHMLELGLLAIAQASRGRNRQYDLRVSDLDPCGVDAQSADLACDGKPVLAWQIRNGKIVDPADFGEIRQLRAWANAQPDDELFERVAILRRGLQVAGGRMVSIPILTPGGLPQKLNACYAFQAERIGEGNRTAESLASHAGRPDGLLAELR